MALDSTWTSAQLGHEVCNVLVAKGKLKEKPAFIRQDREAKIVSIFENINLDGQKMNSFTNVGPLEMLVRKGTDGETWVQQVVDALVGMLPAEVAKATKQMGMDEETKAALEAAHQRTIQKAERAEQQQQQQQEEGTANKENGKGNGENGKGNGKNGNRDRGGDREDRGGWDNGGYKEDRGKGGTRERGGWNDRGEDRERGGWNDRGGDRERGGWSDKGGGKEEGGGKGYGGKGRGKKDRTEMKCNNCGNFGHKSRDCPEPVNEEAVRQRLAAKAAKEAKNKAEVSDD